VLLALIPFLFMVLGTAAPTEFLTLAELAEMLRVPVPTIYKWRHLNEGPRGIRVGRHVRYRRSDVEAWLEQQADDRPAA
jgi:excisionase family DNA binding protein